MRRASALGGEQDALPQPPRPPPPTEAVSSQGSFPTDAFESDSLAAGALNGALGGAVKAAAGASKRALNKVSQLHFLRCAYSQSG